MPRFKVTVWSEHADTYIVEGPEGMTGMQAEEYVHEPPQFDDEVTVSQEETFWGDTVRAEVEELKPVLRDGTGKDIGLLERHRG